MHKRTKHITSKRVVLSLETFQMYFQFYIHTESYINTCCYCERHLPRKYIKSRTI